MSRKDNGLGDILWVQGKEEQKCWPNSLDVLNGTLYLNLLTSK